MRKLAAAAFALAFFAPAGVAAEPPKFAAPPVVKTEGDSVRIDFEANIFTDVAVEILDEKGVIIRHLAAGMLGPFAPEPLQKDSRKQSLVWDRRNDDGKPVAGPLASPKPGEGGCKVRVGLGLGVRYGGEFGGGYQPVPSLPCDGRNIDNMLSMTCGADGTMYMLGGFYHPHVDRFPHLIALDKDGNYLREIYPPPAKLVPDKTPGMATLRLADGTHVPQAQSWWDLFIPMMTGVRNMAATADGHLLLAQTAPEYDASRRALLKLGADGSVPKDAYALMLPPGMHTTGMSMAASLDSRQLYVSGMATTRPSTTLHVVYRLDLDGSNKYALFFGEEKVPGGDEKHLNDPAGVAVGKDGIVYVADYGNGRVLAVKPDGALSAQFKVDKPFALAADPKADVLYVLCGDWVRQKDTSYFVPRKLRKLSGGGEELASADVAAQVEMGYGRIPARFGGMGINPAAGSCTIWTGVTSFPDGCNGYPLGYSYGVVKVRDDGKALSKAELLEISAPVFAARRKARAGAGGVQRDGYSYAYIMKGPGDPSVIWMTRKDVRGQDAPFPAAGEKKWVATLGRPSSRYYGQAVVNYSNDILFSYYNWLGNDDKRKYAATCIDLIAADGTVKKRELVYGLHEGCFATPFLVDRKGNIYVSDHIQPPGRLAPEEVEAAFSALGAKPGATYADTYGSIFKFAPTGGGFKWGQTPPSATPRGDLIRNPGTVQDSAWNNVRQATCEGAEWQFIGIAPVATTRGRCMCSGASPALDGHARLFIPDAYRMCVHVLDTNGNYLLRIGRYGNQDDAKGQIAFARPRFVSASARQITVTDPQNGKGTRIDLIYAAEEITAVP